MGAAGPAEGESLAKAGECAGAPPPTAVGQVQAEGGFQATHAVGGAPARGRVVLSQLQEQTWVRSLARVSCCRLLCQIARALGPHLRLRPDHCYPIAWGSSLLPRGWVTPCPGCPFFPAQASSPETLPARPPATGSHIGYMSRFRSFAPTPGVEQPSTVSNFLTNNLRGWAGRDPIISLTSLDGPLSCQSTR